MSIRLEGVALITGAGNGMGQACAKVFAEAGCRHLVLVDRDSSGLEETIKLLANIDSHRITTHTLDIIDDDAVEKLVAEIPKKYGSLVYALNCAGIGGRPGRIHELSMKDIDNVRYFPKTQTSNAVSEEINILRLQVLNINLRAQIFSLVPK